MTEQLAIRFYAGHPLRTSDGFNLGTFCIFDDKPREEFSEKEALQLKEFAGMVLRELEIYPQQVECQGS